MKIYLTFANNCFKIYAKFTEIGSDIFMKNELIKTEIIVKDTPISVIRIDKTDFISLTDLAKYQNSSDPSFTVKNWLRRVSTIDYIGLWE